MLTFDLGAAYQSIGEPWRRFETVAYAVFEHASQVYLDAMQQRTPLLQVAAVAWPEVKEGDELTRLRGGRRYKVVAPPRYINNGAELELELQALA